MNRFNDLPVLVLLIKIHEKKKKKRKKYRKKKRRDKSMMEHFFYHMACYRQTQLKETRVTWTLPPIIAKKWTVNRPFQFLFPSPKVRRFEDSKARKVRCLVTAVTASIQVEIEMSHVDNVPTASSNDHSTLVGRFKVRNGFLSERLHIYDGALGSVREQPAAFE